MKKQYLIFLFVLLFINSAAQNKYWISFKDKAGVHFDPYTYFSERTILQRQAQCLSLNDSSDFPVSEAYLSAVAVHADSMSWPSRWLNGVAVYAGNEAINIIASLPFVKNSKEMKSATRLASESKEMAGNFSADEIARLKFQTERMRGDAFISRAINGKGMRIAVFDAGFPEVDIHPAFKHLFEKKQIVSTYDFVRRKQNVYKHHWHGTATLSANTTAFRTS